MGALISGWLAWTGAAGAGSGAGGEPSGWGASMGFLHFGQGPLMPAIDIGTRSCTPQLGQPKQILSWLMGVFRRGQTQT